MDKAGCLFSLVQIGFISPQFHNLRHVLDQAILKTSTAYWCTDVPKATISVQALIIESAMVEWDKAFLAEGAGQRRGALGGDGHEQHCRGQSHQHQGKGSELEKKEGKEKGSYL